MNDTRYFGLTPTQFNLAFFAVVPARFVYFGGVGAVTVERRPRRRVGSIE